MSVLGKPQEILVLGLGNVLLQDEGIGVHVVTQIQHQYRFTPEIDILDGGTSGLDLLPEFYDRKAIIIVDAVEFKQEPGYIGLIKNDDILAQIQTKLSIHHLGLADVLSAARMVDKLPEEMVLVGIQPASMETVLELSEAVNKIVPRVIEAVLFLLGEWGISAEKVTSTPISGVLHRIE